MSESFFKDQDQSLTALKSYIIRFLDDKIINAAQNLAALPNANKAYLKGVEDMSNDYVKKISAAARGNTARS